MRFLNTILDIVFPAKCISCGKFGVNLCIDCLKEAPGAERESANWIFPIFDYRHPSIKKALWLLKYKGRKRLVNVFAEIIYEKILEELSDLSVLENFTNPILIPIPLSAKRYRERGFNQAQLICEEIVKISNIRHGVYLRLENNILIKIKETEHQARIKERNIRLKNLANSFVIKSNQQNIEKRNIVLIDDITTTGATLNEARKILKHAGARKVIAFTVAH
jgi:ComF family protein